MVGPDGTPIENTGASGQGGQRQEASANASGNQAQHNPGPGASQVTTPGSQGATAPPTPAPDGQAASKLFQSGKERAERNDLKSGQGSKGQGSDGLEGSSDPGERAAVARLRQAVQRIESNKAGGPAPGSGGKSDPGEPGRKRDW